MLQAMNTGHEGSMSTCHANSPADALRRLETMVLFAGVGLPVEAIRAQIVAAVDLVVQVARVAGGGRRVTEVGEVTSVDGAPAVTVLAAVDGVRAAPTRRGRSVRC